MQGAGDTTVRWSPLLEKTGTRGTAIRIDTTRFKTEGISGVRMRKAYGENVCEPDCLKDEIKDGTPCQYPEARW